MFHLSYKNMTHSFISKKAIFNRSLPCALGAINDQVWILNLH